MRSNTFTIFAVYDKIPQQSSFAIVAPNEHKSMPGIFNCNEILICYC